MRHEWRGRERVRECRREGTEVKIKKDKGGRRPATRDEREGSLSGGGHYG